MREIALIIAFLYALTVTGQTARENKKSVFGASAGLTLPHGDFALKTLTGKAGFASAGANAEVQLMRYTGRFFGLASTIGYANIFISEKTFAAEYDRLLNGYGSTRVKAGNYQSLTGMIGLILKFPEVKGTDILFLFQAGAAMTVHPSITAANSVLGDINKIEKDVTFSAVGNAEIRINHWLNDRYGLSLSYGRTSSTPSFDDETSNSGFFSLPVNYQNLNVGFVMNLAKSNR